MKNSTNEDTSPDSNKGFGIWIWDNLRKDKKMTRWAKKYNENPRGEDYWIRVWQWIALLAFVSGLWVSAMYYSEQVNDEVQRWIDEVTEEYPHLAETIETSDIPYDLCDCQCDDGG